MKNLRPLLAFSFAALLATFPLVAADSFDSQTATIQKSGPHMAKIMVGKKTYMAPVTFADGADWSMVKDHYEVADSVVSGLEKHKIALAVDTDGKASFTRKK